MIIFGGKKLEPVFMKDVGLNTDNTWIVFGCSPFIADIKKDIPLLMKTYRSIGLNAFPLYFEGCEFLATIDANNLVKKHRGSKFILGIGKNDKLYREAHKEIDIAYVFKPDPEIVILEDSFKWIDRENFEFQPGRLLCRHTIALPAVNYALLQGAENVVLIGVDLSPGWKHFYDKNPKSVDIRKANSIRHRRNRMVSLFNKLKKHINIYNLNAFSETEMPVIDIEELSG